jgi:hypothetical protein
MVERTSIGILRLIIGILGTLMSINSMLVGDAIGAGLLLIGASISVHGSK